MNTKQVEGFADALERTFQVLRISPAVKHVSRAKLHQVSVDITLVAFQVRSGCLFDAFALRNPRQSLKDYFSEILTKLREACTCYDGVVLVHDPDSEQLFFVSVPRLRTYMDRSIGELSDDLTAWVSFIELSETHAKVSTPPAGLTPILRSILAEVDAHETAPQIVSLESRPSRTLGDMVAFAACILEFPVAYVPDLSADDSAAFLAGVPLDVYECLLISHKPDDVSSQPHSEHGHIMLKFSCPQGIGREVAGLAPSNLLQRLATRFEQRLKSITSERVLEARHSVQTMDRVAL